MVRSRWIFLNYASKLVIALCLTLVLGGHWFLVQSIAWGNMVWDFSRQLPIESAVLKAFSGESPCDICKFVASGKQSEKKQGLAKADTKIDLLRTQASVNLMPPKVACDEIRTHVLDETLRPPPDSPPPRLA